MGRFCALLRHSSLRTNSPQPDIHSHILVAASSCFCAAYAAMIALWHETHPWEEMLSGWRASNLAAQKSYISNTGWAGGDQSLSDIRSVVIASLRLRKRTRGGVAACQQVGQGEDPVAKRHDLRRRKVELRFENTTSCLAPASEAPWKDWNVRTQLRRHAVPALRSKKLSHVNRADLAEIYPRSTICPPKRVVSARLCESCSLAMNRDHPCLSG